MIALLMVAAMAAGEARPAPVVATTPEPVVTAGSSKENLAKIKCIRQAPAGTRFEKRICKTLSEWNRQGKAAQSDLKQIQDRPMTQYCPPGGC